VTHNIAKLSSDICAKSPKKVNEIVENHRNTYTVRNVLNKRVGNFDNNIVLKHIISEEKKTISDRFIKKYE